MYNILITILSDLPDDVVGIELTGMGSKMNIYHKKIAGSR
jgi:hypothetical protein